MMRASRSSPAQLAPTPSCSQEPPTMSPANTCPSPSSDQTEASAAGLPTDAALTRDPARPVDPGPLSSYAQAASPGPAVAGGKGWNLGRLARYGFSVPRG